MSTPPSPKLVSGSTRPEGCARLVIDTIAALSHGSANFNHQRWLDYWVGLWELRGPWRATNHAEHIAQVQAQARIQALKGKARAAGRSGDPLCARAKDMT